jgi:hypothetical protein
MTERRSAAAPPSLSKGERSQGFGRGAVLEPEQIERRAAEPLALNPSRREPERLPARPLATPLSRRFGPVRGISGGMNSVRV